MNSITSLLLGFGAEIKIRSGSVISNPAHLSKRPRWLARVGKTSISPANHTRHWRDSTANNLHQNSNMVKETLTEPLKNTCAQPRASILKRYTPKYLICDPIAPRSRGTFSYSVQGARNTTAESRQEQNSNTILPVEFIPRELFQCATSHSTISPGPCSDRSVPFFRCLKSASRTLSIVERTTLASAWSIPCVAMKA
jgi:hypothetical protein